MSEKLLRGQYQASGQTPMPVDWTNASTLSASYTDGTVQLFYYNAGTRTSDAGQAAGTIVDGVFMHRNIQNSLGTKVGCKNDKSLTFTCNALTTEIDAFSNPQILQILEGQDYTTPYATATAIGALLANGEYVIDYRKGIVIGKKATTTATMTSVSYKVAASAIISGLVQDPYDYIGVTWNAGTFTETFVYKTGGASGATVATITVVYTDDTKAQLASVTRT